MIYLFIATICFSLSFGLIKSQLTGLPSDFVVMLRLFFAFLIFLPFFKKCDFKIHLKAFFIGIIQFGIMYFSFLKAFQFLQGNEVALLTTSTPIFVAICSSLFGDKFKFIYILCIFMSVLGAGIVVWQNIEFNQIVKGILFMECSNFTFALGQVFWKNYIPNKIKSENIMTTSYLGAFLFILPFVILNNEISTINLTLVQILSIIYLGIIPTGLGFYLWNKGSKLVNNSILAIMNNLKIPFGVLFSIIIFHEKINILNFLIGSSIIIFAIILMQLCTKKN